MGSSEQFRFLLILFLLKINAALVLLATYPAAFPSFQYPKCYLSVRNLGAATQNWGKKSLPPHLILQHA